MINKVLIRKAEPKDWRKIRALCCLTGNAGAPIEKSRWEFFSEFWIGPYQKLCSQWAYVAENNDVVIGYLTGCPQTSILDKKRFLLFDLPLMVKVFKKKYPFNPDVKRFLKRTFKFQKGPERCFPKELYRKLKKDFPAHLHVNVDESFRSLGIGKNLMEQFFMDLKQVQTSRVSGVHVFCGPKPIKFYNSLNFQELSQIEFKPQVFVSCLGKSFVSD
jgi:GNAT superfamily N-acetyltransferase